MKKTAKKTLLHTTQFPILAEKDEDGIYVVECPVLEGCYSQGKTLDHALKDIREVVVLALEDQSSRNILKSYHSTKFASR